MAISLREDEKQILIAVATLNLRGEPTGAPALEAFGEFYFCSAKMPWAGGFERLLSQNFLIRSQNGYQIAEDFASEAAELRASRPRYLYWYSDYYDLAMNSPLHSQLCNVVYGKDLCQTGMMTLGQINRVIDCIKGNDYRNCLDLGCGNGMITEYISDAAAIHATGIDFSRKGIAQAQRRTADKAARLTFSFANILNYTLPANRYDAILSFDSLYFLNTPQMRALLTAVRNALRSGGKFIVFYSSWEPKDEGYGPNQTKIATLCQDNRIEYEWTDYTGEEKSHWINKHAFLVQHQVGFAAEGNTFLWKNRMNEAEHFAALARNNKISRYMYAIQP